MISYREKEMMMAMKYLADHTNEFAQSVVSANESMINGVEVDATIKTLPEISSYDDIVRLARENGYEPKFRIEDLLSAEELEQLDKEYNAIEEDFRKQTGLNKTDAIFIVIAVALQMVRQVLQPKVNFDALKSMEDRESHDKTADDAKENDYDKNKADKYKDEADKDNSKGSRYYYAKLAQVADIAHVPYDVVNGSKKFGIKLSGTNHRVKTLGHDPWLGYLFGTCNILTNTMSLGKDNAFRTLHIGKDEKGSPAVVAEANAAKMVEYSLKRFNESKATVGLAVVKQAYHIKSDEYSKEGLPLPFLQLLLDSDVIKALCESGIDFAKLEFLGTIGVQTILSELISYVISVAHRVTIVCEDNKKKGAEKIITKEELIESLKKQQTLNEVRTRKVIVISESIASAANAIVIGAVEVGAVYTENPDLAKEAVEYLDLGGYLSTIIHLFTDIRFITKIKKEFIAQAVENNYKEKLDAIRA